LLSAETSQRVFEAEQAGAERCSLEGLQHRVDLAEAELERLFLTVFENDL
jgi:hypothetical protein